MDKLKKKSKPTVCLNILHRFFFFGVGGGGGGRPPLQVCEDGGGGGGGRPPLQVTVCVRMGVPLVIPSIPSTPCELTDFISHVSLMLHHVFGIQHGRGKNYLFLEVYNKSPFTSYLRSMCVRYMGLVLV